METRPLRMFAMSPIKSLDERGKEREYEVEEPEGHEGEVGLRVTFVLDGRVPVSIVASVRNQIALALLSSEFEYEGLEIESPPQGDVLMVDLNEGSLKASHINKLIGRLESAIESANADAGVKDVDISVRLPA